MADPERLFGTYHQRVFRYVCRAVGGSETARDLTQEVFLRASRSRTDTDGDGSGWLFRIARNLVLDHYRTRSRNPEPVALEAEPVRPASQDVSAAVNQALAALDAVDRDVFLMREVGGLGYRDIAAACDLSEDAVRSRIHRTRHDLRARLAAPIAMSRTMAARSGRNVEECAQPSDMTIWVRGFQLTASGPEQEAGVSRGVSLGPADIGKPTPAVFSMYGCGGFSASPAGAFAENAIAGWRMEITPTKVAAKAVTFRLRWVRALDTGRGFSPASEDLKLTLRPGESRTIDRVPFPKDAKTLEGQPCAIKSGSLRISVEFNALDRRLIGAEVWLVERLPSGKEESQLQSVRGLPHRDVPFYFDAVSSGADRLDFFGHLTSELEDGGLEIAVEVTRAKADRDVGYQAARWFRSTIHVKPNETVEVALTAAGTGEPAGRVFALRIRAKQIR